MEPNKPNYDFDAFISYSSKDNKFAEELENQLEKYKPPKEISSNARYLKIFRYQSDMTGSGLNEALRTHLDNSAKLIIICSPDSCQSMHVEFEIKNFLSKHTKEDVIPVLYRGKPNNEIQSNEEDNLKAFPEALCNIYEVPLAKEYRNFKHGTHKIHKDPFENSWYGILAEILEKKMEEVTRQEFKRRAKNRRNTIAALVILAVILGSLAAFAFIQKNEAEYQAIRASDSAYVAQQQRDIAQLEKERAEFEAGRANDSAEVAIKQRSIAQFEAGRAEDSARVAKEQREIAVEEAQRAEDSAKVAVEQRQEARLQRDEAEKQKKETDRQNKILKAENMALKTLQSNVKDSILQFTLEALKVYNKESRPDSILEVNKWPVIFLAANKALHYKYPQSIVKDTMYYSKLIDQGNQIFGFGNKVGDNTGSRYTIYDNTGSTTSLMLSGNHPFDPASTIIHYKNLYPLPYMATISLDNTVTFWKIDMTAFEQEQSIKLTDLKRGDISDVFQHFIPSNVSIYNANGQIILGQIKNNHLEESKKLILSGKLTSSTKIDDSNSVAVTHSKGTSKVYSILITENPFDARLGDSIKIEGSQIISSVYLDKIKQIILGSEDGKFYCYNNKLKKTGFQNLELPNKTRIENLITDSDNNYLVLTCSNKKVYIYDFKHINNPEYAPAVIENLSSKVRAAILNKDNNLFLSLDDKNLEVYNVCGEKSLEMLDPQKSIAEKNEY